MSDTSSPGTSRLSPAAWAGTGLGVGLGLAVGAATVLVRRRSSAIRNSRLDELDALADPPTDVIHNKLDRPDGAVIRYVERRVGSDLAPIVLLHGITNQWWMWSGVMNLLPDRRVLSWDMRGFGASTSGAGATIESAAGDLAALLVERDLRGAIVVGHSMGGMVLGRFAADHLDVMSERVGGLLFLSTTGRSRDGSLRSGGLVRATGPMTVLAEKGLSRSFDWSDSALSIALLRSGYGESVSFRMIDDLRRCQQETTEASLVEASRSIARHDVLDRLAHVTTPASVVVGEFDRLTPPLHSRHLADSLPNAVLVELEGIGHNVMQEDPHAVVAALDALHARRS